MSGWKQPLIGVGAVPPSESQQKCVFFVCANRDGEMTPVGTCFLVSLPGENGELFRYFVTAGHVVRGDEPRWIRFRRVDGGPPGHEATGEWVSHASADIAATPCDFDPWQTDYIVYWQEEEYFSDKWPPGRAVEVGTRAYFMGLLADVPHLADRAIPMMRAAVVGALYVEAVPVRDRYPDGVEHTRKEPRAHLIDTYSRSGFSGSPVYADHLLVSIGTPSPGELEVEQAGFSALLGVLVGHFGSPGDNAGVAIVVPIEALRELLDHPDLVSWRQRKAAEMKANRDKRRDEGAAHLDAAQEPTEFERFTKGHGTTLPGVPATSSGARGPARV